MAYIIDADWIIEIARGNSVASQVVNALAPEVVAVSWMTLGEIYEVAFNTPHPEAYMGNLQQLLDGFVAIGVDRPIIERFAEVRALLRRQGQLISDLDIIVAATALARDLTVLTYNRRHFERVPDLRIYQAG